MSWNATIFFGLGSSALGVAFYAFPSAARLIAIAGLVLFGLFGWYLYYKKDERASLGSSLPAILGPLMAQVYVEQQAPHLQELLHRGGDTLIQLAFLFASWIGLVVYQLVRIGDAENQNKKLVQTGYILTLLIILIIAFVDPVPQEAQHGPYLVGGYSAPSLTGLTVCRALVVLWGIILATAPSPRKPE